MIKKIDASKWKVDIRPNGISGKRFRKFFNSQAEAKYFENWVIKNYQDKEWIKNQNKKDSRKISELAKTWYQFHGINLKNGKEALKKILQTAKNIKDPIANKLKANDYILYRAERLKKGIAKATLNNELAYLKGVFNFLIKVDEIDFINPVAKISRLKIDEQELSFLSLKQINILLDELKNHKGHCYLVAKICLATGCRWGEAISLKSNQINDNKITFSQTKSGKNRTLPIDQNLSKEIIKNLPIVDPFNTFKRTIKKLNLEMPKGQLTHILRHTFASHLVMSGVDLVTVQKALGHSSLKMTMRYAHLSKNHLKEALKFNPLNQAGQKVGKDENKEELKTR